MSKELVERLVRFAEYQFAEYHSAPYPDGARLLREAVAALQAAEERERKLLKFVAAFEAAYPDIRQLQPWRSESECCACDRIAELRARFFR